VCGRYASSRRPEDLAEEFEVDLSERSGPGDDPATAEADYNVAPTKPAMVVLERRPRPEPGLRDEGAGSGSADAEDADDEDAEDAAADDVGPAAGPDGAPDADERPAGDPVRQLRVLRWGLVPSWAKDRSVGNRMINARAETLLDKPAYRRAAVARRCLVPADGWYEWQQSPTERDARGKPRKQPFFMHSVSGAPVALAGVYELWRDRGQHPDEPGNWLATYAVVTTAAEPGLTAIHDRMPLVLPPDRWDAWLDPDVQDPDAVRALLQPPVAGRFLATPVRTLVNAPANNGPELLEPVPIEELHGVIDPATGELIGGVDAPLF
jgi:putative SOS response-associated peptidase YedK